MNSRVAILNYFCLCPAAFLPAHASVSPPYKNHDTTTEFHKKKQQFQQYLCTWSLRAPPPEELYSRKLEKKKLLVALEIQMCLV